MIVRTVLVGGTGMALEMALRLGGQKREQSLAKRKRPA